MAKVRKAKAQEPEKAQHGGARPGAGRPAGGGNNYGWLRIRAPEEMIAEVQKRADRDEVTFAEWVRTALGKALRR